jgi:hypothetical protein
VTRGHVHVFPCDPTLTADEAWHEICLFGRRVTYSGLGEYWAVVRCDGEECSSIDTDRIIDEVI